MITMSYDEYNVLLKKSKYKYKRKFDALKGYYENYNKEMTDKNFSKLCRKYRKLIIRLIREVSKNVLKYYDHEVIIMLSGSLARHSNNLFSDIDLNFLTNENDSQYIIELEDIIDNILCNVMEFRGRDKVHTMAVYLPLKFNDKTIKDRIIFKEQTVMFNYRPNYETLMFENYNSTRNIDEIINYLNNNDTINNLNEWTSCFEIIYNKGNLKRKYKQNRKVCKSTINLIESIDNLLDRIEKIEKLIINKRNIKNKDLKKIYKTDVLFNTYEMLAIVFRYDDNIKKFNLDEFAKKSKIIDKREIDKIYKHLRNIQNLQLILNKMELDLSSHSDELIDLNIVNEYYKSLTNKNDIMKDLEISKSNLYETDKKILKNLRRKLNEKR